MMDRTHEPDRANGAGSSGALANDAGGSAPADAEAQLLRGSLLPALYKAISAVKLPVGAANVTEGLRALAETASAILDLDGAFEVRISGRTLHVNFAQLQLVSCPVNTWT